MRKTTLHLLAFISGFVVLSLEILAFRMLAPYFGSNVFVSGSVITVILTLLSAGYYCGGWLADRKPNGNYFYWIFGVSALNLTITLFFYSSALNLFSRYSTVGGAVLSSLALYTLPVLMLSMVSPLLIKLHAESSGVGRSAGNVYAVSTLGSILGSILTTFVLVPFLGVKSSLFVNIILLVVAGALVRARHFVPFLGVSLLLVPVLKKPNSDYVYYKESAYNSIFVVDLNGIRILRLNQNRGAHSSSLHADGLTHLMVDDFLFGPQLTAVKNILILGGGAGSSAEQMHRFYHPDRIDVLEIDPEVSKTAPYLRLTLAGVNVINEDGRRYLKTNNQLYDMVELDMFSGSIYIPYYVATKEFFSEIAQSTTPEGIMMMNIVDIKSELAQAILDTVHAVYPHVYTINDRSLIAYKSGNHKIVPGFKRYTPGNQILTDNASTIDWLTYRYVRAQNLLL